MHAQKPCGETPFSYILRYYLPLEPDAPQALTRARFDALLETCRRAGVGAVMFYVSCHPQWYYMPDSLGHTRRCAQAMAPWARRLREAGVSYQLNFQNIAGSWDGGDDFSGLFPCERYVNAEGQAARSCACLLGPQFRSLMGRQLQAWAETKPDVLWIDDDFRLHNHSTSLYGLWRGETQVNFPLDFGCYCERHLAAFAEKMGRPYTREALVRAVLRPGKASPLRAQWLAFLGETMTDAAAWIERTVHAVSPATRVALMTSVPDVHAAEGRSWASLLPALSGGAQPILRPHFGPYAESAPREFARSWQYLDQLAEDTAGARPALYPELENTRFTVWSKSLAATRMQLTLAALMGCPGITLSLFDLCGVDLREEGEWAALLAGCRPLLDRLAALQLGSWQHEGVALITHPEGAKTMPLPEGGGWPALCGQGRIWADTLPLLGVPCRFCAPGRVPEGAPIALDGYSAALLTKAEFETLLRAHDVLLDARAAALAQAHGLAALTGVRVGENLPFVAAGETWREGGPDGPNVTVASRIPGNCWAALAPLEGAKVRTRLFSPRGETHPGLVTFQNAAGRTVAVWAAHTQPGDGFFTKKRAALLRGLLQRMGGGAWAAPAHNGAMLTLVRTRGKQTLAACVNLSADPVRGLALAVRCARAPKRAFLLDGRGRRRALSAPQPAPDGLWQVSVPCRLPLYGAAVVLLEGE
ncbi:MAG TPA: hypothetical protein H9883_02940 [Candidatus Ruthenibacterium merdigallinarum]|nr:hypothetical protein [Candidatus Ruthenibacterium merdigallinarum]